MANNAYCTLRIENDWNKPSKLVRKVPSGTEARFEEVGGTAPVWTHVFEGNGEYDVELDWMEVIRETEGQGLYPLRIFNVIYAYENDDYLHIEMDAAWSFPEKLEAYLQQKGIRYQYATVESGCGIYEVNGNRDYDLRIVYNAVCEDCCDVLCNDANYGSQEEVPKRAYCESCRREVKTQYEGVIVADECPEEPFITTERTIETENTPKKRPSVREQLKPVPPAPSFSSNHQKNTRQENVKTGAMTTLTKKCR